MTKDIEQNKKETNSKGIEEQSTPEVVDPAEIARQEAVKQAATEQLAADTAQAHGQDLEKAAVAHSVAEDIAQAVGHPLDFVATAESAPAPEAEPVVESVQAASAEDELDAIAGMGKGVEEVQDSQAEEQTSAPEQVEPQVGPEPQEESAAPSPEEVEVPAFAGKAESAPAPESEEEPNYESEPTVIPDSAEATTVIPESAGDGLDAIEAMGDGEEAAPAPEAESDYESSPTVIPDSDEESGVGGAEVAAAAVAGAEVLRNPSAMEAFNRVAERGVDAVIGTAQDMGNEARGTAEQLWTGRRAEGPSVIREVDRLGAGAVDRGIEEIRIVARDLGAGYAFVRDFDKNHPKISKAVKTGIFGAIVIPGLLIKGAWWGMKKAVFGLKWLKNEIVPGFLQLIGQKDVKFGETPEANVKLLEKYKKDQEEEKKKEDALRKKK